MQIYYPPGHVQHQSPNEIFNGELTPHQETPDRLTNILAAVTDAGYTPNPVSISVPSSLLSEVHDFRYLDFLETLSAETPAGSYAYPSVFRYRGSESSNHLENQLAQLGHYSFDLYTPVGGHTWQAAQDSASCAYQAAQSLSNGQERVSYALGRPPGHHAERDQMGGYCYLNNCAVAAQSLSSLGRVATLDVDFHHGNGTQHIFYDRSDVLTTSLHAHPDWKFPFFSGFETETGLGAGSGYNLNRALPAGTSDTEYQLELETVLSQIAEFNPEFLVVSLGLDTHEADPIGGFALTTNYYTEMARSIAALDLPTAIIQEGGYNTELLGKNVVSFLQGFSN